MRHESILANPDMNFRTHKFAQKLSNSKRKIVKFKVRTLNRDAEQDNLYTFRHRNTESRSNLNVESVSRNELRRQEQQF